MIVLKSQAEIEIMQGCNVIVNQVLDLVEKAVVAGVSTLELDRLAEHETLLRKAVPAFKGYRGFPRSICVSVNEAVVHGIPSERCFLKEGDIVGLDFGAHYRGFYGDAARTVAVGRISPQAQALVKNTRDALFEGIQQCWPGRRVGDIGKAVQAFAEARGHSVVRDFVGHGIGMQLHEEPTVPNFDDGQHGARLREGMVLAIEPMINAGRFEVRVLDDGWTVVTKDGSLSAHFEYSVAVTTEGPRILGLPGFAA